MDIPAFFMAYRNQFRRKKHSSNSSPHPTSVRTRSRDEGGHRDSLGGMLQVLDDLFHPQSHHDCVRAPKTAKNGEKRLTCCQGKPSKTWFALQKNHFE